jgi:hypothetical protein
MIPRQRKEYKIILQMIKFLYDRNYQAYDNQTLLDRENWRKWPWDIIWKK